MNTAKYANTNREIQQEKRRNAATIMGIAAINNWKCSKTTAECSQQKILQQ